MRKSLMEIDQESHTMYVHMLEYPPLPNATVLNCTDANKEAIITDVLHFVF